MKENDSFVNATRASKFLKSHGSTINNSVISLFGKSRVTNKTQTSDLGGFESRPM